MRVVGDDKTRKFMGQNGDDKTTLRVLRLKTVLERIGVGRSTAYDWMNPKSPRYDVTFPHSIKLSGGGGGGAVGWIESDINRWIDSRIAAGNALKPVTPEAVGRREELSHVIASAIGESEQ